MADVDVLREFNNIVDNGSTRELTEASLRALISGNVNEDSVLLEFSANELLNVKAELGSRYVVKEIRLYTSTNSLIGTLVTVSQDDITYVQLEGEAQGSYLRFPVNGPVQYIKVTQDSRNVKYISPKVTVLTTTATDSTGSSLFGSSTINSITFGTNSNTTKRYNSTKSWFLEPASSNSRGKKREFPQNYFLASTSSSLDIIDADTMELWMRFNTGASTMLGSSQPTKAVASETKVYVATQGGLVVLDFDLDKATKYTSSGDYQTSSTIANRNSTVSYTERSLTVYTNNILSNTINDLSVLTGVQYYYDIVALATNSGLSIVFDNYAVANCTDGTNPILYVDVCFNRKIYWAGFNGSSGEVSYLTDAMSAVLPTSTFSRSGYYSGSTSPSLVSENVKDLSSI